MILDLYAGPGGWDTAAGRIGLARVAGIELDAAACQTRAAAGHHTVRADVSRFPVDALSGRVTGLIASPPCTTFSAAGKRAGAAVTDVLDASIRDAMEGGKTRAAHRREMAAMLHKSGWPKAGMPRGASHVKIARRYYLDKDDNVVRKNWIQTISAPAPMDVIWKAVRSASLVVEPARFIHACRPEWVALEQVPAVLPLWQVYADELGKLGYSVWCGTLNAADFGVPQVRERAILIASRCHAVQRPPATHYDPRRGMQLFGLPWVSMASALGWGMTDRPYFTLATAGGNRGGADEQVGGSGARRSLYAEPDAGRWVFERPATTVQGDPRIGRPGHKGRERGGESQFALGAVRVTVAEAATLQGFPPDYPWSGPTTRQHQQIGNAIPPPLAEHVLAEASGITRANEAAA